MNVDLQSTACDIARLELFLSGDLVGTVSRELMLHLDKCDQCRRTLEELAAEPESWTEAQNLLRPASFDPPANQDADAGRLSLRQPLHIQSVLDTLGPTDDPAMLGRLGGYEVSGVVGAGGMGVVLKAIDKSLDRTVAIKVLAPHLASSGAARKRFAREAKAAAAVLHPNVIAIHSVSNDELLPYLVTPYLRGTSLQKRLDQEGPLALQEVLRIGSQIAAGLAAAHAQGLVHRDIKPANILLEDGVERVTITDFGLARAVDDATITHSGIIAGTPQYMSPEQARGETVDAHSDLFSLGSVLYASCTGRPPFRAETSYGVMRRITDDQPTSIRDLNPEIPEWLCAIIAQLMSKRITDRFASAAEVAELLEQCLAHVQQPAATPLSAALLQPVPARPSRSFASRFYGVAAMITVFGISLCGILLLAAAPVDIGGEWSGEEWGRVVLKQSADGGYSGTYTDTFGTQPGEIQLKWSRIERRFNGTWREGDARFGEISLRLIGKEIRGAHTTDAKSKINPATPRLAELAWHRVHVAGFGPVLERTVEDNVAPEFLWFDLEQGKSISAAGASPGRSDDDIEDEEFQSWLITSGIDIGVSFSDGNPPRLLSRDSEFIAVPINEDQWEQMTPAELRQQLRTGRKQMMEYEKTSVATYGFQTRAQSQGILQLVAVTEKPRGLAIRYKLVSATAAKRDARLGQYPDLTNLKGEWKVVSINGDSSFRWRETHVGDRVPISMVSLEPGADLNVARDYYVISPLKRPKQFDVTFWVENLFQTQLGIYDLKGDSLTLCVAPHEGARPTKFVAESQKSSLIVLKRVTPAKLEDLPPFGAVIDRVLNDPRGTRENCALNLATGELITLPDALSLKTLADSPGQRETMAWARKSHVDVVASVIFSAENHLERGLLGPDLLALPIDNALWDRITTTDVANDLNRALSERGFMPEVAELTTDGNFPATYLVNTRTNRMAILQITGLTDKPRGVKIRYKLIPTTAKTAAGTKPTFGPEIERLLPTDAACREQYFQFKGGQIYLVGNGPGTSTEEAAHDEQKIDEAGGVDISTANSDDSIFVYGGGCIFTRDVSELKWDKLTAEEAVSAMQRVGHVEGVVQAPKSDLPITYLFRTARGEIGLMEVLGLADHREGSRGMKFRYKLVEGGRSSVSKAPLIFGPDADGLQAALEVTPGEPFGLRLHIRNVSEHSISIDGAAYRQEDECLLADAQGRAVPITNVTHDIKIGMKGGYYGPGQVAVFQCAGLSFQAPDKAPSSAGYAATALPGRYTLRLRVRLPGDDVPFAAGEGSWKGILETGPVTIAVKDPATQPVAPVADAVYAAILGPVVEREISDLETARENSALHFDSGKLISTPAVVSLDKLSIAQPEAMTWTQDSHVDAVGFLTMEGDKLAKCGLLCPGLIVIKANNKEWVWDSVSPGELKGYFEDAVSNGKAIPATAELSSDSDFPANFLILNTRTHRRGVLQIVGVTEDPRRVKIRYRLVEGAPVKRISAATGR